MDFLPSLYNITFHIIVALKRLFLSVNLRWTNRNHFFCINITVSCKNICKYLFSATISLLEIFETNWCYKRISLEFPQILSTLSYLRSHCSRTSCTPMANYTGHISLRTPLYPLLTGNTPVTRDFVPRRLGHWEEECPRWWHGWCWCRHWEY